MKWLLLFLAGLPVSSCDRLSQRIWNCSSEPLPVTKVLDTGERVSDVIPAKNYIASMKGGAQVITLQQGTRVIWQRGDATVGFAAASPGNVCHGRNDGLIAEQF
jgi:hypothetical protein